MKIFNEIEHDFSLTGPKVAASQRAAVVYNVKKVTSISDENIIAFTGRFFVSVKGTGLQVGEIWEGRMEIEGEIQGIEFLGA